MAPPEGETPGTKNGETPDPTKTNGTTTGAAPGDGAGSGDDERYDEARAKATIATQRQAERAAVKRAETAEASLKALEAAKLTDSEKQTKELEGLRAEKAAWASERQAIAVEKAVTVAAREAGAVEPGAIADLMKSSGTAEFDNDGNVTNAKQLVDAAKARYPRMFGGQRGGSADGGAGAGRTNGTAASADWVRAIGR